MDDRALGCRGMRLIYQESRSKKDHLYKKPSQAVIL
jgi:hypothetical protein